jgi:hypothetical protein
VNSVWLDGFYKVKLANASYNYTFDDKDFRKSGHTFFTGVQVVCQIILLSMAINQNAFSTNELITAKAISRKYAVISTDYYGLGTHSIVVKN